MRSPAPLARRALVVEDHGALRRGLEESLTERCREVRSCGSLPEAQRLLARYVPDLILLDLALGDGDGLELARAVARMTPRPALIVMTAGTSRSALEELRRIGVADLLLKPFTRSALDRALHAACVDVRGERARGARPFLRRLLSRWRDPR
jgi:DNA-binding response OmpR family regulator